MSNTAQPGRTAQKFPYFEEDTSVEVVNARLGPDVSPRMREVMGAVVKHLHAAVKEIEPTHEEWMAAIMFLTGVGHMCTEWRQEFILLSDTLGVSMLVDSINHRRPSGATENTILGPFHVADAPEYRNGADICLDGKGEPCLVRGRVLDTAGNPVAGVKLDVWQTNDDGFYDVQQRGHSARLQPARRIPVGRGGPLLVPLVEAALLPDPGRRAGRQDARDPRPPSEPLRPHPFHPHGAWLRHRHHSHL